MPRIDSGEVMQMPPDTPERRAIYTNGNATQSASKSRVMTSTRKNLSPNRPAPKPPKPVPARGSIISLIVCVGGIYASFLTWGLLQERITTTPYQPLPNALRQTSSGEPAVEYFKYPVVINTIQSLFAFISGSVYLLFTTGEWKPLPSTSSLLPLALVAITTTLASPFGYASLSHVDYLTFILAKSCKLLPVMALHITLFGKRYPLSKYLIVLTVTAGVAIFTIYHPPKPGKVRGSGGGKSSYYGLLLLSINLLFDGLTNTLQDHIFKSPHRYGPVLAPQMMVSSNLISFILQLAYLLATPFIPLSSAVAPLAPSTSDLPAATAFISRHPSVLPDILSFCIAGAIGQLFIFATLERFSSLVLVTVTVTRKMLTMVLSVAWFGKRLAGWQWVGVALVFGGVVVEGWLGQKAKTNAKTKANARSDKIVAAATGTSSGKPSRRKDD